MRDYECWSIGGHDLEYIDSEHIYLCDGVIVPSITQILKFKFGGKYNAVDKRTLQNASEMGTKVHEAIENFCRYGEESDLKELKNFKFLQKHYGFKVKSNEIPVILSKGDEIIGAGRLDLVLTDSENKTGLADIKRTSTLDKDYLAHQLNLYRIAFEQSWNESICFLKGIHLREDVRKYVDIPINEEMAWQFINEYLEGRDG